MPVHVTDRTEYYVVRGADAATLVREMAERGPQHPTGRRAWAYTAWELRSRYALERHGRACRLLDPEIVLDVTVTLPRWEPQAPAPARLRSAWRRMLDKATAHERVHRLHGIEAAHAAAAAVADVPATGDCSDLERRLRSAVRRAIGAATQRSRVFDRETDYGRRAGVRLDE